MIKVTIVKPSAWDSCRILSVDWGYEKTIVNKHIDLVDKESHEKQLEISNQQLRLGELLNNDLQKEVDRLNGKLEEKQKLINDALAIVRNYREFVHYHDNKFFENHIGTIESLGELVKRLEE